MFMYIYSLYNIVKLVFFKNYESLKQIMPHLVFFVLRNRKMRDISLILTNIFFTFCCKNLIDYTNVLVILETL